MGILGFELKSPLLAAGTFTSGAMLPPPPLNIHLFLFKRLIRMFVIILNSLGGCRLLSVLYRTVSFLSILELGMILPLCSISGPPTSA